MDSASIPTKTPKGVEEIETRKYKVDARLRTILIAVNGKASAAELAQRLSQLGDIMSMLDELAKQGYLQTAGAGDSGERLKQARRELSRMITEVLGPMGDDITMKVEKAATLEELRAYLETRRGTLDRALGAARAAAFWSKAATLLG